MVKTFLKTALLAGALALSGAQFVTAADTTLRATANSNENDEDYDGLVVFKNYVENASNGAIAVDIFMGTQICATGEECLQGIADGSIDIYMSTSGGAAGLFPYLQILDLPYLMDDDRVAEEVLSGPFTTELRDLALADSGDTIRLMTIGNTGGWRNFANTEHTIKTPDDMDGMKLRTVPAELPQELVKSLGASPTPIAWPELFTSLQTGVVQGTANGITDIMNMKFPDAGLKYITLDRHSYMAAFWWMSNARFEGLTDAQKKVVVDGFYALQQATFASPKRKEIAAYEAFLKDGGEIYVPTEAEKEKFRAAVEPVFEWFQQSVPGGEDIFASFTAAVETAENSVNAERADEMGQ
ncbi:TRAP transporter substrate-binding protein DctP [Martelella mediterranea]|uniref:TRAP-type C4-dicarboxylate transport system substrate-binding protein n=1 Tax=Martelella mediterranea TaxID=293089 RepID=A0A4R3NXL6_9HYPH|nr:TRAP transporter substrate-binding protein DctP [Martelella mediterranea]TCT42826.1 TRAP-type C4-dicarboxylate transport system substrate-binding protein [Martelella mediterranea]